MSKTAETNIKISKNYQENVDYLNKKLGKEISFDIVVREIIVGGKKVAIYSVNGMIVRPAVNLIMEELLELERADLGVNAIEKMVKSKKIGRASCRERV